MRNDATSATRANERTKTNKQTTALASAQQPVIQLLLGQWVDNGVEAIKMALVELKTVVHYVYKYEQGDREEFGAVRAGHTDGLYCL